MTLTVYITIIIANKILLINSGSNKDEWILPGGEIKNKKNFIDEVKNLFFEQTGFQTEINSFYKQYKNSDNNIISLNGKLCGGKMKKDQKKENIIWIPVEQANKLDKKISTQADLIKMIISDCLNTSPKLMPELKI